MSFIQWRSWPVWLVFAGCLVLPRTASASISFNATATGTGGASDILTATAVMFLPGQSDTFGHTCSGVVGTLCMTLENTQAGGTLGRGDVLATLYFSVTGNPTLTAASALADVVLRPNSTNTQVLSVAPQSPVLAGGWALATNPGVDTAVTQMTLPTSGYAWTTVGNQGAFSNGTYNVGSDNYALISGTNAGVIGGGIPVISNEVFLTLTGFQSGGVSLALSQINGVVFTWNSAGTFDGPGISSAPEPATAGMMAIGLLGAAMGGGALRRRLRGYNSSAMARSARSG